MGLVSNETVALRRWGSEKSDTLVYIIIKITISSIAIG